MRVIKNSRFRHVVFFAIIIKNKLKFLVQTFLLTAYEQQVTRDLRMLHLNPNVYLATYIKIV